VAGSQAGSLPPASDVEDVKLHEGGIADRLPTMADVDFRPEATVPEPTIRAGLATRVLQAIRRKFTFTEIEMVCGFRVWQCLEAAWGVLELLRMIKSPTPRHLARLLFQIGFTYMLNYRRLLYIYHNWFRAKFDKPEIAPQVLRAAFEVTAIPVFKKLEHHTHGLAAAERNAASAFMRHYATTNGYELYMYQGSAADERHGVQYYREAYWAKDLLVKPKGWNPPNNAMIGMVDVDMYINMPAFLSRNKRPVIIYTFQPTAVSRVTENFAYTFDSEGFVHYYVTGGEKYRHQVWNYGIGTILAKHDGYTSAYIVNRRKTGIDHELILLTPLGGWYGESPFESISEYASRRSKCFFLGIVLTGAVAIEFSPQHIEPPFSRTILESEELKRLKMCESANYNRLQIMEEKGVFMSTGMVGKFASVTVPIVIDELAHLAAMNSKSGITVQSLTSFTEGDRDLALMLLDYHKLKAPKPGPLVFPVGDAVRSYQFKPDKYDEDAKDSVVAFMQPLIHEAYAPQICKNNEEQMVQGRIIDVRPQKLELTEFIAKTMNEFASLLIPEAKKNSMVPVDYETVKENQPRPTQQRILEEAEFSLMERQTEKGVTKSFPKKELYGGIKDSRCISTIDGADKRDYSAYMYSFAELMKKQPWYAFGMKPVEISYRVTQVLKDAKTAVNTDFSRFDGHVSNLLRELERACLMRAFKPEHLTEVAELHTRQYGLKGIAPLGTKYDTGYSRLSGSPETSVFNSLDNAFIAYLTLRRTKERGRFLTPTEAWARLGVYGGDDGLTADVEEKIYVESAKMMGQVLTVEPVNVGDPGIKFLARLYSPGVWHGVMDSCCDLKRQLSKLHATVKLPSNITPWQKLCEKARSFLLTDENTPIIGPFCKKVQELNGGVIIEDERLSQIKPWNSTFDKSVQYPNAPGDWMDELCERDIPTFDHKKFDKWLSEVKTQQGLLKAETFAEPSVAKSTVPVVESKELVGGSFTPTVEFKQFKSGDEKIDVSITQPIPVAKPKNPLLQSSWAITKPQVVELLPEPVKAGKPDYRKPVKDKKDKPRGNKPQVKDSRRKVEKRGGAVEVRSDAKTVPTGKTPTVISRTHSVVRPASVGGDPPPYVPFSGIEQLAATPLISQSNSGGVNSQRVIYRGKEHVLAPTRPEPAKVLAAPS
jgi:hypothetical protein